MTRTTRCFAILTICSSSLLSQTATLLYRENFDSVVAPHLPAGWISSAGTSGNADFQSVSGTLGSTVHSAPNAVAASNARAGKRLWSPRFDFFGVSADSLIFWERRSSSSFDAGLYIEVVVDSTDSMTLAGPFNWQGSSSFVRRALPIPDSISGKSSVVFRWVIVPSAGGGISSTIRFDDISITAKRTRDLALEDLRAPAGFHGVGEEIRLVVTIRNTARDGEFAGTIELRDRCFSDTASRIVVNAPFAMSLAEAGSEVFEIPFTPTAAGKHDLSARILLDRDENGANDTASTACVAGYPPRTLLINEIMYAPSAGPEWIEAMNIAPDTVSLASWRIGDSGSSRPIVTSRNVRMPPGSFAIIARDSSILQAFPEITAPLVTCPLPALNNDDDAVVVVEPSGLTVDSVVYVSTWGGGHGVSLERIDTNGGSTERSNWGSSRAPEGATPGCSNSIVRKLVDAALSSPTLIPSSPVVSNTVIAEVEVVNRGRIFLSGFTIRCFVDDDCDSLCDPIEEIGEKKVATVSAGDSMRVRIAVAFRHVGMQLLMLSADVPGDEMPSDNAISLRVTVGAERGTVVIDEIMYAPEGDMPEWIECRNIGTSPIDLHGWRVSDSEARSRVPIAGLPLDIPAGGYIIISADSSLLNFFAVPCPLTKASIPALNNSSPDAVILFDAIGGTIDSVRYSPTWGGTGGKSLQRVSVTDPSGDSTNWRSMLPTPGIENSVARKAHDLAFGTIRLKSRDSIVAVVRNEGNESASGFSIHLSYDSDRDGTAERGEEVGVSAFDGVVPARDSSSMIAGWPSPTQGLGTLILSIEWEADERASNNTVVFPVSIGFAPSSVVINEILYEASIDCPEFVEIFNRSRDTLNLEGWNVRDGPTASGSRVTTALSDSSLVLLPGSFAVAAADSSIVGAFGIADQSGGSRLIVTGRELGFGNSGDDVVLYDQTGQMIDSVRYAPSWFHDGDARPGRSLERISPSGGSCDGRNWSGCALPQGATPGMKNSLFAPVLNTAGGLTLSPNPFSPDGDGVEDNLVIGYHLSAAAASIRVRIYDITGREIRKLADGEPGSAAGMLIWNGLDNDGRRARIGMYIVFFEALDLLGGNVQTWKTVAVLATRMR